MRDINVRVSLLSELIFGIIIEILTCVINYNIKIITYKENILTIIIFSILIFLYKNILCLYSLYAQDRFFFKIL